MKAEPQPTVIVSGPDLDGAYTVVERHPDGRLVLVPQRDPSAAEMHAASGTRPLSAEEFERHFGHLPTDGEG